MFRGKVECFDEQVVSGWLVVGGSGDDKPRLDVVVDGQIVGSCIADHPRPDVAAAGHGDGLCGFAYVFPAHLDRAAVAAARLRLSGTEIYLSRPVHTEMPGQRSGLPAWPLFIVGSPRSGTSILTSALLKAGYRGFEEGNLLGLIRLIERDVERHFRAFSTDDPSTLIAHVDREALEAQLYQVFKDTMMGLNPRGPWLDKTGNPEAILSIPRLLRLWPTAKVIFAKRRGIENVVSRLRKFPEYTMEYHCRDWAMNMSAWRSVRQVIPPQSFIEVEQRDMVDTPAAAAGAIGTLLDLAEEAVSRLVSVFAHDRAQETEAGSATRVVGLAETGWSTAQVKMFRTICGPEMELSGYSMDGSYLRESAKAA